MLVDCYFDLSLGNFQCACKILGWIKFDSINLSEMSNPCQRYLTSTEKTASHFLSSIPSGPQSPVSNELAWTSWVEMITFYTGGRIGMDVENGQSIFLEWREEQGQRKLKKASKLIFDLNLKAKTHFTAKEIIHFLSTWLSSCVVLA